MREGKLKLALTLGLFLLLAACDTNYGGDLSNSFDGGAIVVNEEGRNQYNQQCVSCHGVDGTSTAPLVNCSQCSNVTNLAKYIEDTMPNGGNEANCVGQCADDTAEYIMAMFNRDVYLGTNRSSLVGVTSTGAMQTLRKAALDLAGRLPTAAEEQLIINRGEEGLSDALDSIMSNELFYERLMEFYNDQLLTDKYLTKNEGINGAVNLLDNDDFENVRWFDIDTSAGSEGLTEDEANALRNKLQREENCVASTTNNALAREPLELVKYLAKNDLPITGVVDADYIMVNWYSQKVYDADLVSGENPDTAFATMTEEMFDYYKEDTIYCRSVEFGTLEYDPNDFRPARITKPTQFSSSGTPHSGMLTSIMFLNRFPTTTTNRNRHRSKTVYDFFLDTDILAIKGDRPGTVDDETQTANPTLETETCYNCHTVMDPVASAFQHWTSRGRYVLSTADDRGENKWSSEGILAPGLGSETAPVGGANSAFSTLVPWLGSKIASDPRFSRATVRTLFAGLMGKDPMVVNENSSAHELSVYQAQRQVLDQIGNAMAADNWNIKTAVKALVLSPYYRAATADASSPEADQDTGAITLLSPEQLQRKLKSSVGREWSDIGVGQKGNRILFGGMDSNDVTTRMTDLTGIMVAIQQRMAVEMSCRSVPDDFVRLTENRYLFPYVELDTVPENENGVAQNTNIAAIKDNIRYLHWRLLGEDFTTNDDEVEATYQLFYDVWSTGNRILAETKENRDLYSPRPESNLRYPCYTTEHPDTGEDLRDPEGEDRRLIGDPDYVVRSWVAVLTYLLSDYRFIYE